MADYIITPHKKEIPSSYSLYEELHRRALSVEMEIRGTNYKWESIYFFDPVSPETQCFVERNLHSLVYKISLPAKSTDESEELQKALVEVILHEVGGKVYDPDSKESRDLKNFKNESKDTDLEIASAKISGSSHAKSVRSLPPLTEILWIVLSWAFVLLGLYVYCHVPQPRKIFVLIACVLALISAGGITFSKTSSK